MRSRNATLALLTLIVILALSATTGYARAQSSAPTIHIYSRETLVDVTVTDAKGHPVHNLKQSDFTITEDGKPQPIRSFHEFGASTITSPTPAPKLAPHVYTNLQPASGPLNVLLLDDINGGDRVQSRWDAARFIKSMAPGTQVALLALGARLTVLQGPTSDPARLLKVVNVTVQDFEVEADPCGKQVAMDQATLDQLNQIATYLSGIKGRKNLIWIGNGIPDMVFGGCQLWTAPLQKTYDLLEDAEVTIYPLDPNGVSLLKPRQLAMEAVAEATGGVAFYERNDLDTLMAKAVEAGSSYYTLSYIPPGQAYDGQYHTIGIQTLRLGLHLTYRKGYSAEDPRQILHPAETLASIATRETPSANPSADPLNAAMSPITPPATQLLFDVRAEPTTEPPLPSDPPLLGSLNPKLRKALLTRYDLLYAVPSSQVTFTAADDGVYSGSLEFDVAAFDPTGALVTVRSQTMKLPLTNEEYKQFIAAPFQFFQQLDLPPGQFTLRVGIQDGVSSKIGTLDIPLTIPATHYEGGKQ